MSRSFLETARVSSDTTVPRGLDRSEARCRTSRGTCIELKSLSRPVSSGTAVSKGLSRSKARRRTSRRKFIELKKSSQPVSMTSTSTSDRRELVGSKTNRE